MISAVEANKIIIINKKEKEEREEKERIERERIRKEEEVKAINNFCDDILMPLILSATDTTISTHWYTGDYKDRLGQYDYSYRKHNGKDVSVIYGYKPLNFEILFSYLIALGYKPYFEEVTLSITSWCGYSRHWSTTKELMIEV